VHPETLRLALHFASEEMIKEAFAVIKPLAGAAWGGIKAVGRGTGVSPLVKGIQTGDKAMRGTGYRRLAGTAIGTGVVASGVSAARNVRKTSRLQQQRYGSVDPRFRRPNPAQGHSQSGLY